MECTPVKNNTFYLIEETGTRFAKIDSDNGISIQHFFILQKPHKTLIFFFYLILDGAAAQLKPK